MKPLPLGLVVAMCIWFQSLSSDCRAGFQFLGPTPYLSAADSPFPVDGSNPRFFLEDFEDGELNTPGIYDDLAGLGQTAVLRPGPLTQSVDSDDGVIDGDGTNGHSLGSRFYTVFPTLPQVNHRRFLFSFDDIGGCAKPTAFGFVWTDGPPGSTVRLRTFDTSGVLLEEARFHGIGETATAGTTANHRFLGVISPYPLGSIEITSISLGSDPGSFQIDHVQYGVLVPEPSAWFISVALALFCGRLRRSRKSRGRDRMVDLRYRREYDEKSDYWSL